MKGTILQIQNADGTWRSVTSAEPMTIKGEVSMVTGTVDVTKVDWVEWMKLQAKAVDQR